MKITVVHGQNHKGSTYHIARILLDKLLGEKEITEFFLPKDLNHFCLGCYQCIEDEGKCPFYAEKRVIIDAMESADLLIFTTANYCMGPTASMKALLDLMFDFWMPHRPKEWMFKKKAVVISTAAGTGSGHAIKSVKKSLFYWGVPYIKTYGISVQAKSWAEVSDKKRAKIDRDMQRLSKKLSRVKTPKVGIKTKFIFRIMAHMHSSGLDSSPVEKQYWEERGWLDKKRPWKS